MVRRSRARKSVRPGVERLEIRCVPALFAATLPLSALNGGDGFVLEGVAGNDRAGQAVAGLGDVNGDGFDDLLIGAPYADPNGSNSGAAYVLFGGSSGFPADLSLAALNGSNGFVLNGVAANDAAGQAVAGLGDINGDGIADFMIAAAGADPNGNGSGAAYVVFGKTTGFDAAFELSSLLPENGGDGSNGFVLNGAAALDRTGTSVAGLGDVNGDGLDDLLIGAPQNSSGKPGVAYVVFGQTSFAGVFELSSLYTANGGDGSAGFILNGFNNDNRTAAAVAGLGDINGDGLADLLISGYLNGGSQRGEVYVIFGRSSAMPFAAELDLATLDDSSGLTIRGFNNNERMGNVLAGLGDVNGDGIDDLLLGAPFAGAGDSARGQAYVVFGRGKDNPFSTLFELSSLLPANGGDGSKGFIIEGVSDDDQAGRGLAGLGDVNGDGIDDLLVGAAQGSDKPGEAYVIYGRRTGFDATLSPTSLDGVIGFVLEGAVGNDRTGFAVAGLGDVNGDGLSDLLVGASRADPNDESSGAAYVVFGRRQLTVVGPDRGSAPWVRVFHPDYADALFEFLAYPETFLGGVRVAVGNVAGDSYPDIITVPGAGLGGRLRVIDGKTRQAAAGVPEFFYPYGIGYTGGLFVAVADVHSNPGNEIIVSAQKGPRPVRVFSANGTLLRSFFAYGTTYNGPVRVAAGNLGFTDTRAEIVTSRGSGASLVRVWDMANGVKLVRGFKAFGVNGGNFVSVGNVDNDAQLEVIVSAEGPQPPRVRWFNVTGATVVQKGQLAAYTPNTFNGGVRVGIVARSASTTGRVDILVAPGKGRSAIRRFNALTRAAVDSFFAYGTDFTNGMFVAGI